MSDNNYSWKNVRYGSRRQMSQSDQLTRWILIAIFLAIVIHIVVLIAMKKMPIFFSMDSKEIVTQSVVVRNVEERDYIEPIKQNEIKEIKDIAEPTETTKNLLEELEMLEEVPEDAELDFSPTIDAAEILVPIEVPALTGALDSLATELTSGINFTDSLEETGSTDSFLNPAVGQIMIDPGNQAADLFDPDKFNTELAKGAGGDVADGSLEGFTPLAEMTRLSQADLENAKGMIGSDLLYDFNKAILRESAKNSLLKVVLIIDKNPNMKCWIEGHTDLIGSEEANAKLSLARAEAVKHWLVNSMKISEDRLFVRGLGMSQPIVLSGDQNQQAINRRVEIKMRKNPPPKSSLQGIITQEEIDSARKPRIIKPLRDPNVPDNTSSVTETQPLPPRAIPVDDSAPTHFSDPQPQPQPQPPRAIPVEENAPPTPTDPIPPKAIPVE